MATFVGTYKTCSIWVMSSGRYGVRGYTTPAGSETDGSFNPTWGTVEEARKYIDITSF